MSLIKAQGAGEVSTGFYSHLLDQSLKFNDADVQYLTRTPASAGNRRTWTLSFWVKFSTIQAQTLFATRTSTNPFGEIRFEADGGFFFYGYTGSAYQYRFDSTALFRDTSAWYNFVFLMDTTDSTEGNRTKIYVNGSQITAFDNSTYPTQNLDTNVNNTVAHDFGYDVNSGVQAFDGYLAEINFIDGTALTADSFGETKKGIWIPKDTSDLTFGTNGFHLTFKDDVVSEGFNTVTYKGNSGTQSISGVGFSPGLVWGQARSNAVGGELVDVVRGNDKWIEPYTTDAEATDSSRPDFDADGFTIGNSSGWNNSSYTYVTWCWEAGGTPTADNSAGAGATPTAGSVKIDGSNLGSALAGSTAATRLSANTSRGFSIVKWNSGGSTQVAHGLGQSPDLIIIKSLNGTENWLVGNSATGFSKRMKLNTTDAEGTSSAFSGGVTSTTFTENIATATYDKIAYCWHSVSGYSKIGSYTGSGSAGKQVTGLGFKPAWLMIKSTTVSGSNWAIWDNTRSVVDPRNDALVANGNDAEFADNSSFSVDFLSDGFELNSNYGDVNQSSATYIYMAFADTREAAFFKDVTSNGNHFTPVNLDYRDSVPDTPTNNFATFNPLNLPADAVLSEGNTKFTQTSNDRAAIGNMAMSSGKWYYEVYYTAGTNPEAGLARVKDSFANSGATGSSDKFLYITNATSFRTPAWTSTDATGVSAQTSETVLGFAIDADNGKAFISVNGTYINSGNPAAGSNPQATFDADWVTQTGGGVVPFIGVYTGTSGDVRINFGQDSSFSGAKATANSNADGEGHGSFQYAPPSGFLALCSQNLPDVDIIDGTEHFNTVTYTGNGTSGRDLEGFGFQPGFVWLKERGAVNNHILVNGGRGADKGIHSDSESTLEFTGVTSAFTSDGITLTDHGTVNNSSDTYVAWAWKATESFSNDTSATGVGNVDSSGLVNTTAGFSFTTWQADNSVKNIAHGMGKKPTAIWTKPNEDNWFYVYHVGAASDAETDYLALSRNNAVADYTMWNDTAPTSSLWTVGVASLNSASNEVHISFLFADVEGFSKSGSYVGNGNADGPFIYTGFRPAWIMQKKVNNTGHWHMWDSTRNTSNEVSRYLLANENNAEYTDGGLDILSNGFKPRKTGTGLNASGDTYVYTAFADQPFKFANAR